MGHRFVIVVVTFAIGLSACINAPVQSKLSPTVSSTCSTEPARIEAAVRRFIVDWNGHDQSDFERLLTTDAELDMSTQGQGVNQDNNWTAVDGSAAIDGFAKMQWNAGEVLSFSRIETFAGGAYVYGLTARFADKRQQKMTDAKFVYDACARSFRHIVIVASAPASL